MLRINWNEQKKEEELGGNRHGKNRREASDRKNILKTSDPEDVGGEGRIYTDFQFLIRIVYGANCTERKLS